MFAWFDAAAAKAFGETLARFYAERLPLSTNLGEKQFAIKTKEVLDKMGTQIDGFRRQNKLNTYKTAQLANRFKWTLKDAGYDDGYIDKLTQWLVARLQ